MVLLIVYAFAAPLYFWALGHESGRTAQQKADMQIVEDNCRTENHRAQDIKPVLP